MELVTRSAVDLARDLATGALSSVEVVAAHLDRIDERNPELNAIVARRDRADVLADAAALDRARTEQGATGPLHGLPVAVKDLEDVAGLPTRAGSPTTSDRPAVADGLVAARLRAAGAVIIGKTNTPEFGTGSHTFNPVYGVTRNPHDPSRSAGGSSGGAAAALASHMLPVADGSDLGGSLRNPAAFCGVVGLRPGIGRVPTPAVRATHMMRLGVRGPMGRTVADCALMLSVLAGPDRRDPLSLPDPGTSFAPPLAPAGPLRIGWAGDFGLLHVEPEIIRITRAAVDRLGSAGHQVRDDRPDLAHATRVFRVLRGVAYRDLGSQLSEEQFAMVKATVQENIEFGRTLTVDDVLEAERLRAGLHAEMNALWDRIDVLALPTTQVMPFDVDIEFPTEIGGVEMHDYLHWMSSCFLITPTGCPAMSIPCGTDEHGMPVGLQLVAPIGGERRLLEMAATFEAILAG